MTLKSNNFQYIKISWNWSKAKQMEWEPSSADFLTPEITFLAFAASLLPFIAIYKIFNSSLAR